MNQKDNLNNICVEELTAEERQAYEYLCRYADKERRGELIEAVKGKSSSALSAIYRAKLYSKRKVTLYSIFLGWLGVDRFYIGDFITGIFKPILNVLTLGLFWALDIVMTRVEAGDKNLNKLLEVIKSHDGIDIDSLTETERSAYDYISSFLPDEQKTRAVSVVRGKSEGALAAVRNVRVYSKKSLKLFSVFLGGYGVDHFYVGDVKGGIDKIVFNLFSIWWLYDIINLQRKADERAYKKLCFELNALDRAVAA